MAKSAPNHDDILEEAKNVLYGNLKIGYSSWAEENYKYVSPSPSHYPYQWMWDSCFHAITLSHFDVGLAKNEIRNLLKSQREDGFIPHVIFWSGRGVWAPWFVLESKNTFFPKTSQLIQPPLLAEAVEVIFKRDADPKFLYEVLPKLVRFYRWLAENRDPDNDGLISIIAPYESGMDQSPSFDEIVGIHKDNFLNVALTGRKVTFKNMLRKYGLNNIFSDDYFNVEDVVVNSIYIKNLQLLAKILSEIGDEQNARYFHLLSLKAKRSLIDKCYDKKRGFFFDIYSKEEKRTQILTVKGLIPLILDLPGSIASTLVKKHLLNEAEFWLPFPVPSVAKSEPTFRSSSSTFLKMTNIWRGPTWINMNWYIVRGLKKHGYKREAEKIIEKSVDLVRREGFREFFNPLTGEGYGEKNFGWSTLVLDMILS